MNAILSLVKSDYIKLLALKRTLLLFGLASLVFSVMSVRFTAGIIIGVYALVLTVISYDQASAVHHFYCALPVNRSQIYNARYLFGFSLLLLLSMAMGFVAWLSSFFTPPAFSAGGLMINICIGIAAGVLYLSLMLPLNLCLGTQKARLFNIILYIAFFIVGVNHSDFLLKIALFLSRLPWLLVLLPVLLLLFLFYFLGLTIYNKKEFKEES